MHTIVFPKTSYFTVNGMNASRRQFSLQNCFALTVHKCQGFQFFAVGQAYTALSRAPSWDAVDIPCLNKTAFSIDTAVLNESAKSYISPFLSFSTTSTIIMQYTITIILFFYHVIL